MRLLAPLLSALIVAACAGGVARRAPTDHAADRAALVALHEQQRTAHVQRRAELLVAGQADTLLGVSNGRVSATTRERARASFQAYFDDATFLAWDDVAPPRIRISPDGAMAFVVVEKRVHVSTSPAGGAAPVTERLRYAWLSVYEKRGGAWRMTAIASTDRPDQP